MEIPGERGVKVSWNSRGVVQRASRVNGLNILDLGSA